MPQTNILNKKRGNLHSRLLKKSSAIDALLCSLDNMNKVRDELHLFDDQFKMVLEVHEECHQLLKHQFR